MTAMTRPALALDIGGTKLAVGVVTSDGAVHGSRVIPTHKHEGPEAILTRLFDLGEEAIAAAGLGPVGSVGISCGGPLDSESGVLTGPLHLPGWIDIPITRIATERFGVPAWLVNDASAGMLAEHRIGAARRADIAIYLTISTGMGGGAIVNGGLLHGAAGNGGEFGHVMVKPGDRPCSCGRRGCIEAYASGSSIAARARDLVASGTPTVLAEVDPLRSEEVVAAVRAGDAAATRLWDETTTLLAQAITDMTNTFEPDVVVLGGGVTRAGSLLLDPIRDAVARDAIAPAAAAVHIELAELAGAVCVVGAGLYALDSQEALSHVR